MGNCNAPQVDTSSEARDAPQVDTSNEASVAPRSLPSSVESVAVITGGGSGMGRALALKLAAAGSTVVITGRRVDVLAKVVGECPEKIFSCPSDVSTSEGRAAIAAFVGSRSVHGLVHNAASCQHFLLTSIQLEDYQREQRINVEGPIFLTQALMANLKACKDKARVLMVSSGAAEQVVPMMGGYCISKASMKMLWMHLKEELKDDVQVGYCIPGLVKTEMTDSMTTDPSFVLKDIIASRMSSGDIHEADEAATWMAALLDKKVCSDEDFVKHEYNIDKPEHAFGVTVALTTEAKLIAQAA